ncbi:MAG: GNAT family N-acetyltransferase [Methanomassiliicoccales archaeon]|nr:GNAT family N-acetyltransferase [Methanomassiliicoccales archaeon]
MIALLWEMRREMDLVYGEVTTSPPPQEEFLVPGAAFMIVRSDGRPVGCGAIKPWDERTAEVKRVFVIPSLRRRDIGRSIMEELESKAREMGYQRLFLETADRQRDALEMYSRLGYVRIPCKGGKHWKEWSVCLEKEL